MKRRLTKELSKLSKNSIILTILPRENYHELNMHMIKLITKKCPFGAYININKPYSKMIELFGDKKIKHKNLLFIDCITTNETPNVSNCVFIKSAESLTNIAIALDRVYKSKEMEFIFLDSVDALSNYHNPTNLIKFFRSMIEKTRENNKVGLMIGLHEGTDKKIIDELSAVCDKIINLGE